MTPRSFLAHSSPDTRPPQTYVEHLFGESGVALKAAEFARRAARFHSGLRELLPTLAGLAGEYHDLGKLIDENQSVLSGQVKARSLPRNHVDAGTAYLLTQRCIESAIAVFSHHSGLPDLALEYQRERGALRDRNHDDPDFEWSDRLLPTLLQSHRIEVGARSFALPRQMCRLTGLGRRILLSCLVDADHSDTARYYHPDVSIEWPALRPADRLDALDRFVDGLKRSSREDERNSIREVFYREARNAAGSRLGRNYCDATVGSGKTTSVVAHLLKVAFDRGLDRLIVVLPYTTIIDQTVDVLRRALTLPGEDERVTVTAHHHRVEFEEPRLRHLAFNWAGPIVVTTAVQFFETLAAASTGALRKLHRAAHSVIMVDEAHNCIPLHLWRQHWEWLEELAGDWGSYITFCSGSLVKFWTLPSCVQKIEELPSLVSSELAARMAIVESKRYSLKSEPRALSLEQVCEQVLGSEGPRIVVFNTVEGAARAAHRLQELVGLSRVRHLSTALAPRDRSVVLAEVQARLAAKDNDWTLVATSCVEAGMNFSFRTGFRERASLLSLIQLGGRVNRGGSDWNDAELIDFAVDDPAIPEHPELAESARVLKRLFDEGNVAADSSTESVRRVLELDSVREKADRIVEFENKCSYPDVAIHTSVISMPTFTVVIDREVANKVQTGGKVSARELQDASVQIFRSKKSEKWGLKPILRKDNRCELYEWTLLYDSNFLGYMAGVIQVSPTDTGMGYSV